MKPARRTVTPFSKVLAAVRRSRAPVRLLAPGPFRHGLALTAPLRGPSTHGQYELGICYEGRMTLATSTRLLHLEAGDVVVIQPGTWHYETYQHRKRPYKACWLVVFAGQNVCNFSSYRAGKFEVHWLRGIFAETDHGPALRQLIRQLESPPPRWKSRSRGLVAGLLVGFQQSVTGLDQPPDRVEFEPLDKLLKIMAARFREPIELRALAPEVGMTPNYLSALFQNKMHTTFSNYLSVLRVWYAALLLERGVAPKEAALTSGFKNVHYFTTVFRLKCGIPPAQFQKTALAARDAPAIPQVGMRKWVTENDH